MDSWQNQVTGPSRAVDCWVLTGGSPMEEGGRGGVGYVCCGRGPGRSPRANPSLSDTELVGLEREQSHLRVSGLELRQWSKLPTASKGGVLGGRSRRRHGPRPVPDEAGRGRARTDRCSAARRGLCPPRTHVTGRTGAHEASPTRRAGEAHLTQGKRERDLLILRP